MPFLCSFICPLWEGGAGNGGGWGDVGGSAGREYELPGRQAGRPPFCLEGCCQHGEDGWGETGERWDWQLQPTSLSIHPPTPTPRPSAPPPPHIHPSFHPSLTLPYFLCASLCLFHQCGDSRTFAVTFFTSLLMRLVTFSGCGGFK